MAQSTTQTEDGKPVLMQIPSGLFDTPGPSWSDNSSHSMKNVEINRITKLLLLLLDVILLFIDAVDYSLFTY